MFSDFRLFLSTTKQITFIWKHSVLPFDLPFHFDIIFMFLFNGFTENEKSKLNQRIFSIKNKFNSTKKETKNRDAQPKPTDENMEISK